MSQLRFAPLLPEEAMERKLTLHEVKVKFNLQRVDSSNFFPEWQVPVLEQWLKKLLLA